MGQAWCKEKSTKAQDSKSPLDRVFLRCAHRIYPALKEEGSVLGSATQRVTSSEIGYASSPSREVLTRGQSIDSVDRPFHPSDWVDVNLEVPGTPRTSAVMNNLTLDSTLYPSTVHTLNNSSGTNNLRDLTPIPPPRRRRKNRGRPLPPKPDEITRSHVDRLSSTEKSNNPFRNSSVEPVYSSVKALKIGNNEKEVYEHKVNGTGRVIPSTVVAGNRSYRVKSSPSADQDYGDRNKSRGKTNSTVSLPNYLELETSHENLIEDDVEVKVHKITAAGSLPTLITSGALENLKKNDDEDRTVKKIDVRDDGNEGKCSVDEVDFNCDASKNPDVHESILKLEEPQLTSTPVKKEFQDESRTSTTVGGWFLHSDRSPEIEEPEDFVERNDQVQQETGSSVFFDCIKNSRSNLFFEVEEEDEVVIEVGKDNRTSGDRSVEVETVKTRTRPSLKRTLSNESEPFDSYEKKEIGETETTGLRLNSQVELLGRSISEESLPREMVNDNEETDFFDEKRRNKVERMNGINNETVRTISAVNATIKNDTKTPPPSPEPKIKPEIFDNDHSTLLKVLREEAEESNLSSMTPSLTELEAALSDMLEREDEPEVSEDVHERQEKIESTRNSDSDKILEIPIEPKIVQIELDKDKQRSDRSVSLKNILDGSPKSSSKENTVEVLADDEKMAEVDLTNGNNYLDERVTRRELVDMVLDNSLRMMTPGLEPPEKPSRLQQVPLKIPVENIEIVPTPPRRKNRSSIGGQPINVHRDNFRSSSTSPEDLYPNDRLI